MRFFAKIKNRILHLALFLFVWCGTVFHDTVSFAASKTIGDAAGLLSGQMTEIKQLGLNASMVIGVVLVIMGIIKLTKRSGGEDGPGKAIIFIVAGVLMLAIPAVFKMSTESIGLEGNMTDLQYKSN